MPTTYLLAGIIAIIGLHFAFPLRSIIMNAWRWLGVAPLIVGIFLNLHADHSFKRYGTAVRPFEKSSALVKDGVFRITRNPMYLGFVMILAAVAIFCGSITPWIIVIVAAFLLDRVFIKPEERILEREFGNKFREYKQNVRRWI